MLPTAMYGVEALFRLRCASGGLLIADAIDRADLLVDTSIEPSGSCAMYAGRPQNL